MAGRSGISAEQLATNNVNKKTSFEQNNTNLNSTEVNVVDSDTESWIIFCFNSFRNEVVKLFEEEPQLILLIIFMMFIPYIYNWITKKLYVFK